MPNAETLLIVTLAGLALSVSPGPSMLYVLSRSLGQSRSAGLMSAAGLAAGGFAHVVAAALGLAAVFAVSPRLYWLTQLLGAGYLIYLGVMMLREDSSDNTKPTAQPTVTPKATSTHHDSLQRVFYQGIVVEILNPKTLLFFIAFLPQFVDPERGSVTLQMLILGALVPLTAVPSDLLMALAAGGVAKKLSQNRNAARWLNRLGGLILIGLGLRLLW